jgi:hypothetical protein
MSVEPGLRNFPLTVFDLVEVDLPAESIPVDAEKLRGARLVSFGELQNPLDVLFLKFNDRFIEMDPAVDHQSYQRFQLIFHDRTLRMRVSS